MEPFKRKFFVPIYGPPLAVVLWVADDIVPIAKKLCGDLDDAAGAMTFLNWPICHILFRKHDLDSNCVAHETDHAVHKIFREVGIVESHDSEEAFTHMNGWLEEKIKTILLRANIQISDIRKRNATIK